VQPVRADDEVEALSVSAVEAHVDPAPVLRERGNCVAETDIGVIAHRPVEDRCEIGASEFDASACSRAPDCLQVDPPDAPARAVHKRDSARPGCRSAKLRDDAHLCGDLDCRAFDVDRVAA